MFKTAKREPLSCTQTILSSYDFISSSATFLSFLRLLRVFLMFFGLNISFSMVSINNSKLLLLLCFNLYGCLLSLQTGGSLPGGNRFVNVETMFSGLPSNFTCDYVEKVEHQIYTSSFSRLDEDSSPEFKQKVNNWLDKWPEKITEEWKKFITPNNSRAGKMYGMVKTHKKDNLVRVITSGCNTAVEKLSILVEKTLYPIADNLPSKIKDTNNMLEIIDQLNEFVLTDNFVLVSFDVVNMFPNIDNRSRLKSVRNILIANEFNMDSN